MAITNIKKSFTNDLEKVWQIVTSLEHYTWRTDLSKIEVIEPHKKFIEYTKKGYQTTFTITTFKPYQCYEFDIENDNIKGHWTGLFSYQNGITSIDFTENVKAKKEFMRPFIRIYLKKQQTTYINDLKKALNTNE